MDQCYCFKLKFNLLQFNAHFFYILVHFKENILSHIKRSWFCNINTLHTTLDASNFDLLKQSISYISSTIKLKRLVSSMIDILFLVQHNHFGGINFMVPHITNC